MKEVIEGNILIAQFMQYDYSTMHIALEDLEYHSSWDWLMPVVEKIKKLIDKKHIPHGLGGGISVAEALYEMKIYTPINKVWIAVVNFIKFYTQNK